MILIIIDLKKTIFMINDVYARIKEQQVKIILFFKQFMFGYFN